MSAVTYLGKQKKVNDVSVHASLFFAEHLQHPEQGYGDWAFTHLCTQEDWAETAKLVASFEANQSQYYTYLFQRIALYQRGKQVQEISEKEWLDHSSIEETGIFFMRKEHLSEQWGSGCMLFAWDEEGHFDEACLQHCASLDEAKQRVEDQLDQKKNYSFVIARILRASFWHTHM